MNDNNKNKFDKSFQRTTYNYLLYQLYCFFNDNIICIPKSEYDIKHLSYLLSDLLTFVLAINEDSTYEKDKCFRLSFLHAIFYRSLQFFDKNKKYRKS